MKKNYDSEASDSLVQCHMVSTWKDMMFLPLYQASQIGHRNHPGIIFSIDVDLVDGGKG